MFLDHEDFQTINGRPTGQILRKEARGKLRLIWNSALQRLEYAGKVWDEKLMSLIRSGERPHVSLAAEPKGFVEFRGHNVPLDLQFFSVAAVKNPGIPETTLNWSMERALEAYLMRTVPVVLESFDPKRAMVMEFDMQSLDIAESTPQEYIDERVAADSYLAAKIYNSVKAKSTQRNSEAELSTDRRNDLPDSKFAYVDANGDGHLPIHDAAHVRNALARFNQTDMPSSAKAGAMAKIHAAAKKFGVDVSEQGTEGPQMQAMPVGEPISKDFQSIKNSMQKQYGDKGDSVYYAFLNKHKLDDTKPYPSDEAADGTLRSLIPQGYQNLTPMRPNTNQRSGLTGVTGVSQGVPMQGTDTNIPRTPPEPTVRPVVTPTAQDQQILPRNPGVPYSQPGNPTSQNRVSVDNRNATGAGVTNYRESKSSANKGRRQTAMTEMSVNEADNMPSGGRGDVSQAQQDNWGAETDKSTSDNEATPHQVGVKNIGLASTPYEAVVAKIRAGRKLTNIEQMVLNAAIKEQKISINGRANPETQSSAGVDSRGNGQVNNNRTVGEEEEEEEDDNSSDGDGDDDDGMTDKKAASESDVRNLMNYGYSKEEAEGIRSIYTAKEWPRAFEQIKTTLAISPRMREFVKRGRLEKVINPQKSSTREAKVGGSDVVKGHGGTYESDILQSTPGLEKHVRVIRGEGNGYAQSFVPILNPPDIDAMGGVGPRLEFVSEIGRWTRNYQKAKYVSEAIATTTSGAAMAVDGGVPALVVPTQLAAMLRDTVYWQAIQQGSNIARFQTITVPTAGALTQNTEPSQASQTLKDVDLTPTPRGVEQQISFEAERKILGPILEGVILSFRVSELYDEDNLIVGSGNAFESASIPTSGGLNNTGNQLWGGAGTLRASEGAIISTDTMSVAGLTNVQAAITLQGYAPNNLVEVMQPQQFMKLMQDTNVNRLISFGPNTTAPQSWIAQGVIPELIGFEIRRSTLGATGTGSASITTYHSWGYIKGLTPAMAASRDLMIETFRDIRVNSTWVKGHWDIVAGVLHPNSLVELATA